MTITHNIDNFIRYIEQNPEYTGILVTRCGDKAWYKNGLLHNENGPAIICSDIAKLYYLNGTHLSITEYNKRIRHMKLKNLFSEKL
jgi:hypothetical protein